MDAEREAGKAPVNVIDEENSVNIRELEESSDDNKDGIEMKPINQEIQVLNKNEFRAKRPAPLEILQNVRFNTVQATPRSTIKGFLNLPIQTDLKFTMENLKKAEGQLMKAFVEFYHKLRLLKSYSFLNIMAFSKIMKKYDKVSKLVERVEVTFIKHFSNSNRSKGMNILRPKKKREQHRVTFSTGFLVGCTVSLILALILIVRARKILDKQGQDLYMETMFPLYSLFGFIVLHMLMYAGNVFFWRRYRVNYSFIFGFKLGTELGYREVLLLGFCLSVLTLASVLANLDMEMDPVTLDYKAITELLPLGLVVVTLPDFLLADQLTSQVQALRSVEFYICYYGWGDYKHRLNSCGDSDVFNTFSFIIAGVPYWWRLLQCLRRLYDEQDAMQGYNGVKYFLTIVAVCTRTAYQLQEGATWRIIALLTSGLNVLLRLAWMQTVMNVKVFSLHRQAMTTLVASLEIIRRGIWTFFRLENEHLNNVGKFRAFNTVPMPFNYNEDEDKDE
ncbi:hypothetical protein BUALT_Bualt17G0073600 [Buddleja alternifolia]|uniref:Uncharacterized protein n=1 Tax=Buddleja alternifolia TaxID=168488 RepID=A0AAV6WF63_9LAMI|nr:hypothetical protein BUALT_Bualt17G0073600 [Buddleja alternifolia]